jgi:hypothetical protein
MKLSDRCFAAKVSGKFVVSFFGVVHGEPPVERLPFSSWRATCGKTALQFTESHLWKDCPSVHGEPPVERLPFSSWRATCGKAALQFTESHLWKGCPSVHGEPPVEKLPFSSRRATCGKAALQFTESHLWKDCPSVLKEQMATYLCAEVLSVARMKRGTSALSSS